MESSGREAHRPSMLSELPGVARLTRLFHAAFQRELRSNELTQIFACAVVGSAVGVCVAALRALVQFLHRVDFAIPGSGLLSTGLHVDSTRIILVPALGGLLLGGLALMTRRFGGRDIVDPIEANALYGGRMSLPDSLRLTASTILSNA